MAGRFEADRAALIVHDYEGDHECTTSFVVHWYGWRKSISSYYERNPQRSWKTSERGRAELAGSW
jgi:hypothetical protein